MHNTNSDVYKTAYLREKNARLEAENILELKSHELFNAKKSLQNSVDKLKNQKALIAHQEKLASVGLLAAGVAHEINNPTGSVKCNLSLLADTLHEIKGFIGYLSYITAVDDDLNEKHSDLIHKIESAKKKFDVDFNLSDSSEIISESLDGVMRIQSITESLKNFSKPDNQEFIEFDLNETILTTLRMLNSELGYAINIETKLDLKETIFGQKGAISQVILNLIINAKQALGESGTIKVSTRSKFNHAIISVSDNGCGIPQEHIYKIFDPFFTTKSEGVGTGLGLSVTHGIVQKHGGRITVKSSPENGTVFKIILPKREQS